MRLSSTVHTRDCKQLFSRKGSEGQCSPPTYGQWRRRHWRGATGAHPRNPAPKSSLDKAQAPSSSRAALPLATWMEEQYDWLAAHALQSLREGQHNKVLVGIAGGPGSGKSTLAKEVCRRINAAAGEEMAVVVPMDGFHYYKRQLAQFADPNAAFARRGAHWTFDAEAFVSCIRRIREQGQALVPSFDHGVGDPVEDDISVTPDHRIVLAEGNYLLLDLEPWAQLAGLFDESWFVECEIDEAMARVFARQTGHGVEPEVSRGRIAGNDRPNAELIARTGGRATRVVRSLPFRGPPPACPSDDDS